MAKTSKALARLSASLARKGQDASPVAGPVGFTASPVDALIAECEAWISQYMALPDPSYALVAVVWALHTWIVGQCDATPYLVITSALPGSGKTRFMELIAALSFRPMVWGSMSIAGFYQTLNERGPASLTMFADEFEKGATASVGAFREIMNIGYRKGAELVRGSASGKAQTYPAYGARCLGLLGDVSDTLRTRSIVLTLTQGIASKAYYMAIGASEGKELAFRIKALMQHLTVETVYPERLAMREQEIWSPLTSTLIALGASQATQDRLTRAAIKLSAGKTGPARKHVELARKAGRLDISYSSMALRDLATVLGDADYIGSKAAVDAMRSIDMAPWSFVCGDGLTVEILADLLAVHVGPTVQIFRRTKDASGKAVATKVRGYRREAILAALARGQA